MQNNTIDVPMTFNLPEVQVTAQAPRPGDANYDKYIANTYDAWKRGDVDINTLPTETRNRVRGYSGTIAAQNGMNTAAKVAGITTAIPAGIIGGISFAPTAWGIMNNPIVDAGLTIHGAINAPKNIKEGVQQLQEGNYGRVALDLGLTALDLYGVGRLGKHIYDFPRKLANNMYRYFEPVGYNGHQDQIKDVIKAMIFDNDIHNEVREMEYFPKLFSPGRDAAYRSWLGFEPRTNFPQIYRKLTQEEEVAAKAAGLWKYDKSGRFGQKYMNLTADKDNIERINSIFPSNYYLPHYISISRSVPRHGSRFKQQPWQIERFEQDLKKINSIKNPSDFIKLRKSQQLQNSYNKKIDEYIGAHGNINTFEDNIGQRWIQDTWDINPFTNILGWDFDFGQIFPNHKAINWIQKIPD